MGEILHAVNIQFQKQVLILKTNEVSGYYRYMDKLNSRVYYQNSS